MKIYDRVVMVNGAREFLLKATILFILLMR